MEALRISNSINASVWAEKRKKTLQRAQLLRKLRENAMEEAEECTFKPQLVSRKRASKGSSQLGGGTSAYSQEYLNQFHYRPKACAPSRAITKQRQQTTNISRIEHDQDYGYARMNQNSTGMEKARSIGMYSNQMPLRATNEYSSTNTSIFTELNEQADPIKKATDRAKTCPSLELIRMRTATIRSRLKARQFRSAEPGRRRAVERTKINHRAEQKDYEFLPGNMNTKIDRDNSIEVDTQRLSKTADENGRSRIRLQNSCDNRNIERRSIHKDYRAKSTGRSLAEKSKDDAIREGIQALSVGEIFFPPSSPKQDFNQMKGGDNNSLSNNIRPKPPGIPEGVTEFAEDKVELRQCQFCLRKFSTETIEKHSRICERQKNKRRDKYDIKAKRISSILTNGTDKALMRQTGRETKEKMKKTKNNWRLKSKQLRMAIKDTPGNNEMLEDTSNMRQCPHCSRTFNSIAAERHIPKCKDTRSRPTRLVRGGGNNASNRVKR